MENVRIERKGPIATVELERKAKRNALDMALRDALESTLAALETDPEIKVVILTGGTEMFSAGYDLKEMLATDLAALLHRGESYTSITYFFKKPIVTAVGGFALAGGFDLALSGDVIIAAEGTKLGRPEVQWGVNPLMSKLYLRMGFAKALRFSLRGDIVDARRAEELGIVDRVVAPGDLLAEANAEAEAIARHPLATLVAMKRAAYEVRSMSPDEAVAHEFGVTRSLLADGGLRDALAAYSKRAGVVK